MSRTAGATRRSIVTRPPADLPATFALRALVDSSGHLAVRVTPGARTETLAIGEGRLVARVRAKPEDGKANAAVIALVAGALGVAPSRVELLRGATSREKLLRIS